MEMRELMKSLGLTEYETKAYISLLKENPATGYAVARNSGVPRSKIYEVLDSLTAKGDVLISEGNPPLYKPLSVSELIEKRRRDAESNLKEAEQALTELEENDHGIENIWNIKGQDAIFLRVNECIQQAKERVLLEIWAEDYPLIENSLSEAVARGVKIQIVAYGEITAPFADVYQHDQSNEITEEYGGRWLVFSVDDRQIVAGTVSFGDKNQAAWTMHPGLVMPITEVIIHDLYIAEMLKDHREILEASYGPNLQSLRDKFQMKMDFLIPYKK